MLYYVYHMQLSQAKKIAIFLTFLLSFFAVGTAKAVDPKPTIAHPTMAAKFVSQSVLDPIEIEAGKSRLVTIKSKNVGTEAWPTTGSKFVSAYTVQDRYRKSLFVTSGWIDAKQTAAITKLTNPGEVAELAINLKAPDKLGLYTEEFFLAAENYSWIQGGYFFLKIKVVEAKVDLAPTKASAVVPALPAKDGLGVVPANNFKANKFIQSVSRVEAVGGERVKLILAFQNIGETVWPEYSLVSNQPTQLAGSELSFADELWHDRSTLLKQQKPIEPGKFLRETVMFRTPAKTGEYVAQFRLAVGGQIIDDPLIEIPITVTADAPSFFVSPQAPSAESQVPVTFRLPSEPRIRVGLYKPESFVQFRSAEDDYEVFSGIIKIATLSKNKTGVLKFSDGKYIFNGGEGDISSDDYIRLAPTNNPQAVFTLWNYQRWVTWKGPNNFNVYRGALEYRKGEVKTDLWVVNDLLLEDYVKGIGENSNNSPAEYLKAQSVAQRSYAYATIQSNKYGIFDVVATTGDQLYLGVENEKIMSNFVAAATATRGQMVIYNNDIVITPYFARTNCRTKAWTEVWGGQAKPWLISVKTNYDCARGLPLFGHGVGMSQIDASIRAEKEGANHVELVKYYYTGVEVERVYQ